jgi:ArsR family transcriptional regulator, arsenate/arsenite/antimonite-responsive transcriptional repressor
MTDLCAKVNEFGKAMGNAGRYRIVEALLKGEKTVGELVKIVKLSQPAVSQHLKVLKASNLVSDERRGQEVYYSVDGAYMLSLLKNLTSDVRGWKKS